MRLGAWVVEPLHDRGFALDGGAMFGIVPRAHWSRHHAPDEAGRIRLATRCLLARSDDRVVLVDTGMGDRWVRRARETYAVQDGPGLVGRLRQRDIEPADVTDVVVTHLHFDHAGGLVRSRGAGEGLEPAFPRARVHVQAEHLAWAESPSPRDRASFRAADYRPLAEAGLLEPHEGGGEILPGLEVRISHGHTPAMQIPLFRGDEGTLVYPSDLIPTAAHVQIPWTMAYDNRPLVTVSEKAALLDEALAGGWVVVPDHDPEVDAFTLDRGRGGRLEVVPLRAR